MADDDDWGDDEEQQVPSDPGKPVLNPHRMVAMGSLFAFYHVTDDELQKLSRLIPGRLNAEQMALLKDCLERVRTRYETARARREDGEFRDRLWTSADRASVLEIVEQVKRLRKSLLKLTPEAKLLLKQIPELSSLDCVRLDQQLRGFPGLIERHMLPVSKSQAPKIEDDYVIEELGCVWKKIVGKAPARQPPFVRFAKEVIRIFRFDIRYGQVDHIARRLQPKNLAANEAESKQEPPS